MICSFHRTSFLLVALALPISVIAQQPPSGGDSAPEATEGANESTEDPAAQTEAADVSSDGVDPVDRDEVEKEVQRRTAVFNELRDKLAEAVGDQRATHIRYINKEDRSNEARSRYRQQRARVRELLDETFTAALDLSRIALNEEAATFLVTMIQHRFGHDIYDEEMVEGCARLIDGGSQLKYVFQAGARSAVVSGDFDLAKRLFEALTAEHMDNVDKTLMFNLDEYQKQYEAEQVIREREIEEDRLPRVKLETTQGDVIVELFIDQAPSTVSHFIQLVENDFYDGLDFFQVLDDLLALTGDPSGVGSGHADNFLVDEHDREDARKAFRGSLVMAKIPQDEQGNFIPNTGSSQFAILYVPILAISQQQTVFGRVVEGMDVISRLRRVDPSKKKEKGAIELPPDSIIEATVLRRPDTLPEPEYADLTQP